MCHFVKFRVMYLISEYFKLATKARHLICNFTKYFKLMALIQGDTSVVVLIVFCFGVEFLCCLSLMYVFIF